MSWFGSTGEGLLDADRDRGSRPGSPDTGSADPGHGIGQLSEEKNGLPSGMVEYLSNSGGCSWFWRDG